MFTDTYNKLIFDFGSRFETFSARELANFCSSLGRIGLRQEDILSTTIDRIKEFATNENYLANFSLTFVPIFNSAAQLNL